MIKHLKILLVASFIGIIVARKVEMTSMPQLVAILHSFVGLAAVLVGFGSYLDPHTQTLVGTEHTIHLVEVFIGVFIGAITFTGSIIAWGKLDGKIRSKPLVYPGRHVVNIILVIIAVVLGVLFTQATGTEGMIYLYGMTAIASYIGIMLVMAIGGADMPVVVSMLNSYSGWAAAAAGFMLGNDLLIVTGALVGSSVGFIISNILGIFIGAFIGEYLKYKKAHLAMKAGIGTILGLVFGIVLKIFSSFLMIGIFIVALFW